MDTNFIYTGGAFNSMNERAIRSAIATQNSERTILWCNGEKPAIDIPGLEMRHYTPGCSAVFEISTDVVRPSDHWRQTVIKDIMLWELAESHGGLFLDLDTVCLADATHFLGEHGMVSPIDVPWDGEANLVGWRNTAILMTRAGSEPIKACADEMRRRVSDTSAQPVFFLGPKLLTEVLHWRGLGDVFTPPYRTLGAFGGGSESAGYLHGWFALPPQAKIVHWFSSSKEMTGFEPASIGIR